MCERYRRAFTDADVGPEHWGLTQSLAARAEPQIAPGSMQPVLREFESGRVVVRHAWGLVPFAASSAAWGTDALTARAETLCSEPRFRDAFRFRRCLVPADGWYASKSIGKRMVPFCFRLASMEAFALAGLWESRNGPDGPGSPYRSFCLVTTVANELVRSVSDRMPAIIDREDWERWLDPTFEDIDALQSMLQPLAADRTVAYPINDVAVPT